jgi:peptidyl-prolyl cis-trans isomerase C
MAWPSRFFFESGISCQLCRKIKDNIRHLRAVGNGGFMARATARHILVASKNQCEALKREIENGADFAELARKHSSCPSGREGGDLGEFGPGMMVREFDKVVVSAEINTVQGPVKTQFGYHLLEVTGRRD